MRIDEIETIEMPYKPTEGLAAALILVVFEVGLIVAAWWVNS